MQEILMYFWTTQKNLEKHGAKYLVCYLINLLNFLLKPHKHFSKQLLNFFLPFSFHPTENYFRYPLAGSPPSIKYVKKPAFFDVEKEKPLEFHIKHCQSKIWCFFKFLSKPSNSSSLLPYAVLVRREGACFSLTLYSAIEFTENFCTL